MKKIFAIAVLLLLTSCVATEGIAMVEQPVKTVATPIDNNNFFMLVNFRVNLM